MKNTRSIDKRLDSYIGIYDHARIGELKKTIDGTWVERPFFDLCMHWKAASNALRLPWLTIQCVQSTFNENAIRKLPVRDYLNALDLQLIGEVPNLPRASKFLISSKIAELISRVERQLAVPPSTEEVEEKRQQFWQTLISDESGNEFSLSVMGSQQIAFNAIFGAFENFMREILAALEGSTDFRVSYAKATHVKKYFRRHLPTNIVDPFFQPQSNFDIARIVRNCLAHSAGLRDKEVDLVAELANFRFKFDDQKWIRVWPEDNRWLLNLLLNQIEIWSKGLVALNPSSSNLSDPKIA